jgi:hypothetical protein
MFVFAALAGCAVQPVAPTQGEGALPAREDPGVVGVEVVGAWLKVAEFHSRIEAPGVSVLPPRGSDWVMGRTQRGPHVYIHFVKTSRPPRPVEHLIGAGVHSEVLYERWPASHALLPTLEALAHRFETSDARRGETGDFGGTAHVVGGTTCFRYSARADGLAVPSSPNVRFGRQVTGLTCFHPSAPRLIRLRVYQRFPEGMEPLSIDSEVSPFYESLKFIPLAPIGK